MAFRSFLRRCRGRKACIISGSTILFCVITYLGLSSFNHARYSVRKPWDAPLQCVTSEEQQTQFVKLTYKVHVILNSLGIEHWLTYGSLWGPLRGFPGPLPWDYDVDLGMDGDDPNFKKMTFEQFRAIFEAEGLLVRDALLSKSLIAFKERDSTNWQLDLFLLYDYGGIMRRAGVESWLFFVNYRNFHSFPKTLVKKPLPKVKFGFFDISVPREGIEMMKYLYPTNWWVVAPPEECKKYYILCSEYPCEVPFRIKGQQKETKNSLRNEGTN